ncbi:TPA: CRISPR-associated endonuclease Cas3'', partial [Candidatus Sumerlaeota bacterium]|nr:CRISPR-associated endonuclease Cas3'' [Candidatus Sumerlaeota bacterium]
KVYAHSLESHPPGEWQLLRKLRIKWERDVLSGEQSFDSSNWAFVAAWLHDLGKAHPGFQAYLARENGLDASEYDGAAGSGRVNHSSGGAILAWEKQKNMIWKTLAYLVAGHHAGLPDWCGSQAALTSRLETDKAVAQGIPASAMGDVFQNMALDKLRPPAVARNAVAYHFWARMLFSCLVDADFLDTEAFMDNARSAKRPAFPPLQELKTQLDSHLAQMGNKNPALPINRTRAQILANCRKAALGAPGLFSLTVSMGGGKALSGTAFALDHAVHHGKSPRLSDS